MREEKYQPKMPDIMEAVFDAGYLIFDLVAAILSFYSRPLRWEMNCVYTYLIEHPNYSIVSLVK